MNTREKPVNDYCSRYITTADEQCGQVLFPLPRTWWSRPYEYAWAMRHAEAGHVALDAGCGISHPFKFWLGGHCRETHACDIDRRLTAPAALLKDVAADFGHGAAASITLEMLQSVQTRLADMTNLPYDEGQFDRIFCLSVLEHMGERELQAALAQFRRALRPDGRIVLTVDVPTVQPDALLESVYKAGLRPAGNLQTARPANAVSADLYGERLYVFRLLLENAT